MSEDPKPPLRVPGQQSSVPAVMSSQTWVDGEPGGDGDEAAAQEQLTANYRYRSIALLGSGGMGTVYRAFDPILHRNVAAKHLHSALHTRPAALQAFLAEARLTAQLQHPSILPIHDLVLAEDVPPFFTMPELEGHTFQHYVRAFHRGEEVPGFGLRRLVAELVRVCDAVEYAHSRGVIHRDIKPQNIMLGEYGEVVLLDWGLALRIEEIPSLAGLRRVEGTPCYMAPEQAEGRLDLMGPATDIYALGAVLYELLGGEPPYGDGVDLGSSTIQRVRTEAPRALGKQLSTVGGPVVSSADVSVLVALCEKAMARAPANRHSSASELAQALRRWLDGEHRRGQARELVERADAVFPTIAQARADAMEREREAVLLLEQIPSWAGESDKIAIWAQVDAARAMGQRVRQMEDAWLQLLQSALNLDPQCAPAHERMAIRYQAAHRQAEESRDWASAAVFEERIRAHLAGIPSMAPVACELREYISGVGWLDLSTAPAGVRVRIAPYVPHGRRLVEGDRTDLGTTPILGTELLRGRYVLLLGSEEDSLTRLPIEIRRQQRWALCRPGVAKAESLMLPPASELSEDECVVLAGSFACGGDGDDELPTQQVWCDSFIIKRHPVTNREYLAFLDALVAQGREDEAWEWVPRPMAGPNRLAGDPLYALGDDGHFALAPDPDGDVWELDAPVVMVDWSSAVAYARWRAEVDGLPWRLPTEVEWEKAARGTDGRLYPWGDQFDPSYACTRDSHAGRRVFSTVDDYPLDESPYGVRGLGGNVRDWCANPFDEPSIFQGVAHVDVDDARVVRRAERGGHWTGFADTARCNHRRGTEPHTRSYLVGFRIARSWP